MKTSKTITSTHTVQFYLHSLSRHAALSMKKFPRQQFRQFTKTPDTLPARFSPWACPILLAQLAELMVHKW